MYTETDGAFLLPQKNLRLWTKWRNTTADNGGSIEPVVQEVMKRDSMAFENGFSKILKIKLN